MKRANRAAQFMPFDSLKGLQEALREKERKNSCVPKRDLSEEEQLELSQLLIKVEKGMEVRIIHYSNGHYVEIQDILCGKNLAFKYIVVGEEKIFFADILEVEIIHSTDN